MPGPAAIVVFGSLNVDLVCRVWSIARPGETVISPRFETFCGGKGANQAVAAARLLAAPGKVAMVGAVGDDAFGETARANLEAEGIDTAGVATGREPTGCAFISLDSAGENAITVASGANGELGASGLDAVPLGPETVLVLQMEVDASASLGAAWTARAAGARILLNLAPVPPDLSAERAGELLAGADVVVVNESEFAALADLLADAADPLPAELSARAAKVAAQGQVVLVVTLGAEGALIAGAGFAPATIPAPATESVDTTGAGDTFVGALAVALHENRDLRSAITMAVAAASQACGAYGAQSAMPTRAELFPERAP